MPPAQGISPIPMHQVIGGELQILGTHGLQAHEYPEMLRFISVTGIELERLVGKRIGLDDVPAVLAAMNDPVPAQAGVTVVDFASA
jgi:alcohol dehydrogenase